MYASDVTSLSDDYRLNTDTLPRKITKKLQIWTVVIILLFIFIFLYAVLNTHVWSNFDYRHFTWIALYKGGSWQWRERGGREGGREGERESWGASHLGRSRPHSRYA